MAQETEIVHETLYVRAHVHFFFPGRKLSKDFQNYLYEVHERLKIIFLEKLIGNL